MSDFLLEADGICKSYGSLRANDDIRLVVRAGGKHALIGENGAGKSTLVGILYGAVRADGGTIKWRGKPVVMDNPQTARKLGIGVVFQHFALFESMTVAENIRLGLSAGDYHTRGSMDAMRRLSEKYQLQIDPARRAADLSAGEKQRVEILRSLLQEPQLLILDEPTSVLTPAETRALFVLLEKLADEGRGILFISHKLREVESLCDDATVLRGGRTVFQCRIAESSREELIGKMIGGGEVNDGGGLTKDKQAGQEVLCVRGLAEKGEDGGGGLFVDDMTLKSGVISGIAGIAGNGQDKLLDVISGEQQTAAGNVIFCGDAIGDWLPARRIAAGVLTVPTERCGRAAVGELPLAENVLLCRSDAETIVRRGVINPKAAAESARAVIRRFEVAAESENAIANSLSGGNLQKFIVGRALMQKPPFLAAANPTWGVDVRAAAFIHRQLRQLRDDGAAILIISEDVDELLSLCDEISVISGGRLAAAMPSSAIGREDIGRQMTETGELQ